MYKFQNGLLTSGVYLIFPSLRKIHSYRFKNCTESPLIFYPSYFFYWQLKLRQNSKIWFINSVVGHNIQCIQSKRNSAEANFNIPSVHSSPPPPFFSLPPPGFLSPPLAFLLDQPWPVPPLPSAPLQTLIHHRVCHQDLPDLLMTPGTWNPGGPPAFEHWGLLLRTWCFQSQYVLCAPSTKYQIKRIFAQQSWICYKVLQ